MPLEHLELPAVLETDDVVGHDRPAHRHRRLQFFSRLRHVGGVPQLAQHAEDVLDELRQVGR